MRTYEVETGGKSYEGKFFLRAQKRGSAFDTELGSAARRFSLTVLRCRQDGNLKLPKSVKF